MRFKHIIALIAFGAFFIPTSLSAQDDMLDMLGEEKPEPNYATAGFKTTRIINGHSFEMNAHGVMDFKISHRFGTLNSGALNAFGLDNALMRIGFDYGLTKWLNVGVGRSGGAIKYYDGFAKVKFLRQQTGVKNIPISALFVSDFAIDANPKNNVEQQPYYFSHRLLYTNQFIIGRKFNDGFSLQIMPTHVHRNFVQTKAEANDVILMGVAGRIKLNKRVAINAEYYYALPGQLDAQYKNSLSIGFDIETGGHVFQLHLTNSTGMVEPAFLTETRGSWLDGDIHFGFNVSRVFTVYRPKKK